MPLGPDHHLRLFTDDGHGLGVAAEAAGLDTPVASCPGWTVADLVWHTGEVFTFWADVVEHRWSDPGAYAEPTRPADDELLGWYRSTVHRAHEVLAATDPTVEVWSWAPGGNSVGWVRRRMAHEAAVHRADAEAAAGTGWSVDPVLAADGVSEFFQHVSLAPADGAAALGGTVHLHCTDVPGEWLVQEDDPAGPLSVREEHAKGDAAVRGPASDLLLLLWRRRPLATLEVLGDGAVAERLVARADLA